MEDYEADDVIEHLSKPPIDIIPANIALAGARFWKWCALRAARKSC